MWIFAKTGFISVVQYEKKQPGVPSGKYLLVRARKASHLIDFLDQNGLLEYQALIEQNSKFDYTFRVKILREDFADALCKQALDIDYGNFKAAVESLDHSMLMKIWSLTKRMIR